MALGFIPGTIFAGDRLDASIVLVPTWANFITYAFLHIDTMHIAVNMLFLWSSVTISKTRSAMSVTRSSISPAPPLAP